MLKYLFYRVAPGLPKPHWKVLRLMSKLNIKAEELTPQIRCAIKADSSWIAAAIIGRRTIYINSSVLKTKTQSTLNRIYLHEIAHCLDYIGYGFRLETRKDKLGSLIMECIATHGAEMLATILKVNIDKDISRSLLQDEYNEFIKAA